MVPTIDAYTPREIAHKIETLGVTKARSETLSLLVLAVLAGSARNLVLVTDREHPRRHCPGGRGRLAGLFAPWLGGDAGKVKRHKERRP